MAGKRMRNTSIQRQDQVFEFIKHCLIQRSYAPTLREIGDEIGRHSTSYIGFLLEGLEKRGKIKRAKGVSRGIQILKMPPDQRGLSRRPANHIPLYGIIQAGEPIQIPDSDFSVFDSESNYVDLENLLPTQKGPLFALRVQGDSMKDAMINHGDIVILRPIDAPVNGEMVAAWLKDNCETTLKYFYREGDLVRLQPANPDYDPIYVHLSNLEIKGKVVLVIRPLGE